jgi:hypothetical protein
MRDAATPIARVGRAAGRSTLLSAAHRAQRTTPSRHVDSSRDSLCGHAAHKMFALLFELCCEVERGDAAGP